MKKSDLKNRMVVEYRNGERRMVVGDVLLGDNYCRSLSQYNVGKTVFLTAEEAEQALKEREEE